MDEDFAELNSLMSALTASPVNWELGVRLNQSLEVTDGLWELVPLVVASGEAIDDRPPAEAADRSPAARGLDDETRARVRSLGDAYLAVMDTAFSEQAIDDTALASITPAQMTADPFGVASTFLDMAAYTQQALPAVPGTAQLAAPADALPARLPAKRRSLAPDTDAAEGAVRGGGRVS